VAAADLPAVVADAATGNVLYAARPLDPWRPASLTKLMTLYLVFEALDAGDLGGEESLPVSGRAAAQPPTKLGLAAGSEIAVDDAVSALIVRSANDVAVVLAEAIAGDEATFAALMTFRARDLGMGRTSFANASGLPHAGNVTDARDMAILARALLQHFPEQADRFAMLGMSHGGRMLPSYNGLLTAYAGADGMKTGFTCASGYNLVGTATRDGRRLIGVVLGATSRGARLAAMRNLLDRAFVDGRADGPLADLTGPAPATEPPVVIPPAACGPAAEEEILLTGRSAPAARAGIGGWGLTLGILSDKAAAQGLVASARKRIEPAITGGKPVLIERRAAGITRYSALLTNLSQQQAVSACRTLRAANAYCVTLGPEALKNARAMWW
jgi:D-alanyl-D-alanine carboxypeptidase